ncbi:FIG006285: ICC-like protein phosphoesterase [hydrothermal vent metagenome]|uniref:FIG006285: ICC-like protein phosphoesterase n=1 Tax=hydrothermal vent metagenome TaxID=652676 RepID=A0A3B0RHF6_9ZZZZ
MVPLSFASHLFQIIAPAALYWPSQKALLVADIHLEKASFFARQGQMLPPYDSRATLGELAVLVEKTSAERVFCLGDNYHDEEGEARLESEAAALLERLTKNTEWIWISGNHDRDVRGLWGGTILTKWTGDGLILRHEAGLNPDLPEISGHYHPKLRVPVRGRHVSRRCFVKGRDHLIMPAFGALTGGMAANDPAIEQVVGGPAEACIGLADKLLRFPLPFDKKSHGGSIQPELPLIRVNR